MQPSSAIYRYDLSLTIDEFGEHMNRGGFIGSRVLPLLPVAHESASFSRVKIASVLTPMEDTRRAEDGTYNRATFEWDQETYKTEEHGLEEVLDNRRVKVYGNEIKAEQIARRRLLNRLLQKYEYDAAAAVFDTATWTGSDLTTAVSTAWSAASGSTPVADIIAAAKKVRLNCGFRPNALVMTWDALVALKNNSEILDRVKYSGMDDPKNISRAALCELFEIEEIIVADAVKNTAGRGQATATLAGIWDDTKAMLCHIDTSSDLESVVPGIGRTFVWNEDSYTSNSADGTIGCLVEEYREDASRGTVLRARNERKIKILHPEAGHLLTGITA